MRMVIALLALLLAVPAWAQVGQIPSWPPKFKPTAGGGPSSLLTGIQGYWKLDENTGTTAADATGNGNTLTFTSSPTWTSGGKINSGIDPTISSSKLESATPSTTTSLNFAGAVSMACWVHPANFSAYQGVLTRNDVSTGAYVMGLYTSATQVAVVIGTFSAFIPISPGIVAGVWSHLVVTDDTTTVRVYINGALVGTDTSTGGALTGNYKIGIGQRTDIAYPMSGPVDECGVWSRAITASEVTALYNGGAGRQYPF